MNPLNKAVGLVVDTLFGLKSRIPVQKTDELETAYVVIDAKVVAREPAILPELPQVEAEESQAGRLCHPAEAPVEAKPARKRKAKKTEAETPPQQQQEAQVETESQAGRLCHSAEAPPAAEMSAATEHQVETEPETVTETTKPDTDEQPPFGDGGPYYAQNIMPVIFDEKVDEALVGAEVAIPGGTVTITKEMPVIPRQALELYRACGGNQLRYPLAGVYFDHDSVVGSNGHYIAQVLHSPWEMAIEPFILPAPAVKKLAKDFVDWKMEWKRFQGHKIILAERDETSVTFVFSLSDPFSGAVAHKLTLLEGQYPNIRRVFPVYERRESNEALIGKFVNRYLADIGDLAARINGVDHQCIKIFAIDAHQGITFVGHHFRALVMPLGEPSQR